MSSPDTIAAVATGAGGALAVIRVSGARAIEVCDTVFRPVSGRALADSKGYTLHYGEIRDPKDGRVIDDVVVSLFRAPRSYTGEDMVEISCHGSRYVQQQIMNVLIAHGARTAQAGEFTVRAFLAGKLDLSQAEAVADMIASDDRAAHALASNQMRGGYSTEFTLLRRQLVELVSLLELELDFSEEEVEFADRNRLVLLINALTEKIENLLGSFSLGNAIKEGVAVAIAGAPNVGKSTLLNALLNDDRAMVSDIPGTTRDVIEESVQIDGVRFRFIDTAGIRHTRDSLERMGIERTFSSIGKANIILVMVEAAASAAETASRIASALAEIKFSEDQELVVIVNKSDIPPVVCDGTDPGKISESLGTIKAENIIPISAKTGLNIDALIRRLSQLIDTGTIYNGQTVISNSRHYGALHNALAALERAQTGLTASLATDLLSQDIREALHPLGTITGEITTDEILKSIFSKFCIGK